MPFVKPITKIVSARVEKYLPVERKFIKNVCPRKKVHKKYLPVERKFIKMSARRKKVHKKCLPVERKFIKNVCP